ncbi:hypothetical protein CRENBAI_011686 [Crenichthys baileyi]|uniref:Uncharacterized protein n=1 Tax=Crenichthys baileyi TaxID=28760 RepID=A0AAV9SC19_9TELE
MGEEADYPPEDQDRFYKLHPQLTYQGATQVLSERQSSSVGSSGDVKVSDVSYLSLPLFKKHLKHEEVGRERVLPAPAHLHGLENKLKDHPPQNRSSTEQLGIGDHLQMVL